MFDPRSYAEISMGTAMLSSRRVGSLARRRFQQGQLIEDRDYWSARWREDMVLPKGTKLRNGDRILSTGEFIRDLPKDEVRIAPSEIVRRIQRRQVIALRKDTTKPMAKRILAEILEKINHINYRPPSGETFAVFAENWKKTDLVHYKHSARDSYLGIIDNHLIPTFGSSTWSEITAEVLQQWVSSQTDAANSIYNRIKTLKAMWTDAKRYGKVQHNPFDGLRRPSIDRGNFYFFTLEQIVAILAKTQEKFPGQQYLMMWTFAETAMRPGEGAGLVPEGLDGRILKVTQSIYKGEPQKPKTKNSVRQFPITQELADALREHIRTGRPADAKTIFATRTGTPVDMGNFLRWTLNPVLEELSIKDEAKKLGLKSGTQSFRHGTITAMRRAGIPLKTIQERIGHSIGSEITDLNYSHAIPEDAIAAADIVGALLRPKRKDELIQ